ncbi:ABC transporter ATP-binding protein [Clostridia bacterium]|nr:ABC transporter ATP-binding protein [Clostridia bacterium]
MRSEDIKATAIPALIDKYPFVATYLEDKGFDISGKEVRTLGEILSSFDEEYQEEFAFNPEQFFQELTSYIQNMLSFLGEEENGISSISILPGKDKSGNPEKFLPLTIQKGEIVAIVGPTGSGKSRLLADIEWAANGDTPTGRVVLVDGETRSDDHRFSLNKRLVAQLSQNMNFVMDVTVEEFITLHAKSRQAEASEVVDRIIEKANELSGEPFLAGTAITNLSGGQSRALMIADTAILSQSPIILIDEIENAGIDRKKAMELLVGEEKIVLIATHDPSLALMADKRIQIRHGGIQSVTETNEQEKAILGRLEEIDQFLGDLRKQLRQGETLTLPAE